MILNDREIKLFIESGLIEISPFNPELINPGSLDFRLSRHFGIVKATGKLKALGSNYIDPLDKESYVTDNIESDDIFLRPGECVIASSLESIKLPRWISAEVRGKSSLGRVFILQSAFAGWIDAGFEAESVVLEIQNCGANTVKLTAGMKVGQFVFHSHSPSEVPYGLKPGSKYQNQRPAQGSLYHLNADNTLS